MSGLRMTARAPLFSRFEVSGVAEHSPASEVGSRQGDVITAVNGRPAAAFTLAQLQYGFQQLGEVRRLTIVARRARNTSRVALETAPLEKPDLM